MLEVCCLRERDYEHVGRAAVALGLRVSRREELLVLSRGVAVDRDQGQGPALAAEEGQEEGEKEAEEASPLAELLMQAQGGGRPRPTRGQRRTPERLFELVGCVDGVREELDATLDDPDQWTVRSVVVEVKHRTRVENLRDPPELHDQLQVCACALVHRQHTT